MNKTIILLLSICFHTNLIMSAAQFNRSEPNVQVLSQLYKELQKDLSPLLKAWHPILVEREKYTISSAGIIGRLLLGGIMAGPALTANYINQYLTKEKYKGRINTLTLIVAAASAAPVIRNLIGTTGMAFYDALTYPNIEAIKERNKKVEEKIYIINNNLRALETDLFSLADYSERDKAYADIIDLFKKPRTYLDILTFQNTQKNNIKTFLESHPNYTKERLRLLLERKKSDFISAIYIIQKNQQTKSSYLAHSIGKSVDLTEAITKGLLFFPWILIGGVVNLFSTQQEFKSTIEQNKKIVLIDTILTTLATFP